MRVYTFRLPKVVSGFAKMCLGLMYKEDKAKKRNEKMPD
ncbi:stage V sporulation protein SpoVM [Paenisporosarcina sp. TG20]|nr:stage V sporulation protein SpoVM [Paenisporosarcina sp. TG20]